jgi:mono/diheme cytochrome c family protein
MKEMTMTKVAGVVALASLFAVMPARSQAPNNPAAATPAAADKPEEGIPVTDPLVIAKCGTCHTKDDKGNLSRISWERSAPEGWEEAIKRMVRLNGLSIMPAEARSVLKYLSTYHGLAPEEARPVMYMPEHRIQDEPVVGEFRKRLEFLSFFSLIPSEACATFSLFFCMRSSQSSGLVNPVDSVPLLPSPS